MIEAAYGAWDSFVTADKVAKSGKRLSEIKNDNASIYWLEQRPEELGRSVLMRCSNGEIEDVLPETCNVRTRVHEYGGGAYTVKDQVVYFCDDRDQRIYRCQSGEKIIPLTPEPKSAKGLRYGDLVITPDSKHIICVREIYADHYQQVVNELVAISTNGTLEITVLATGSDFYAFPRVSMDGHRIAWVSWDHPNMPWDETQLWVADVRDETILVNKQCVVNEKGESVYQPEWAENGSLYFVSDRSGWWNLYCMVATGAIQQVLVKEVEYGYPIWVLGTNTYVILANGDIAAITTNQARQNLEIISSCGGEVTSYLLEFPYPVIAPYLASIESTLYVVGASPVEGSTLFSISVADSKYSVVQRSSNAVMDLTWVSIPEDITFPTSDNQIAHAFYYAPKNPNYQGLAEEKPPLLVISHGGPTASTNMERNLKIQFWTSRGFAVVDVNYRGSTGYGRAYREALKGRWGEVDVADCVNAANYLVKKGAVNPCRLLIKGGSAGGLTTLCALTFYDIFAGGASYYGVADLHALLNDTHKFEARYLDTMVGKYPEAKSVYDERSPLLHVDKLTSPVIFFQGLEDKVVPPSQAEAMLARMREKDVHCAYITFANEQHGFRDAANVVTALESELAFYQQLFE